MRNAIIVTGPESSGTRNLTRLILESGYSGKSGHSQPYTTLSNVEIDKPENLVVRWSIPHSDQFVDLSSFIAELKKIGYSVRAIITTRDWNCMIKSQVRTGHVNSIDQAKIRTRQAYQHIFSHLNYSKIYYETVSYESLIYRPIETLKNLGNVYQLDFPLRHRIKNGNKKYYSSEEK